MLTSVPASIKEHLVNLLQAELKDFSFCSGGCINHGGLLNTSKGSFFLKWNDCKQFPGMFEAEAKGLKLLKNPSVIHVPEVVSVDSFDRFQFLLLEFIEEKRKSDLYWENLGHQLAALHKITSSKFGLDHNNYIGSLQQFNKQHTQWISFFIEQRLDIQLKLAIDSGKIKSDTIHQFQLLSKKLPSLLPEAQPSLLHGDLWSGNLITNEMGEPCLIDPAVFYGHREAEIAFTQLFGGFSKEFYHAYNNAFPLEPGFQERCDIYNLYPLLVHVNLFGGGYLSQVVSVLRRFV